MMEYFSKQSPVKFAICSVLFAGILYLFYSSSLKKALQISVKDDSLCQHSNPTAVNANGFEDPLGSALAKASDGNRTVIITIVNKAYADQDTKADTTMLDLFVNSLWLGEDTRSLVDHLLVVAVDSTAYSRCQFLKLNCYRLETDGVDFEGEKIYMSQDFIKMMWRRTLFLTQVLKRGYHFIFTDTDVMWLRNPFAKLSMNETEDLQISTDAYLGNPWSEQNPINTGFYFARSNNKTIALFETWYGRKDNSTGKKEQDVLLQLIRDDGIIGKLGLKVRFLDTLYFSGFCEDSKDIKEVTTVHANCCRSITAKISDLKAVMLDWKRFNKSPREKSASSVYGTQKQSITLGWRHYGCWKSWRTPDTNG